MSETEIKVPNIGDFKDVEVIEVLVSEGQILNKNDPLITIESDKSSVEVPSEIEGVVSKINVNVGDKVSKGDLILEVNAEQKNDSEELKVKKEKIPKDTENLIREAFPDATIDIQDLAGDGNHYSATITSSQFSG